MPAPDRREPRRADHITLVLGLINERARVEVGIPDPGTGEVSWTDGSNLIYSGSFIRATCSDGRLSAILDAERAPEYRLRIIARGYEPFESRAFRSDESQVEYDVKLTPAGQPQGVPLSGVVHRPDGTPLEGAEVAVAYPHSNRIGLSGVFIENGTIQPRDGQTVVKTDAEGRFSLTREPDPEGQYYAVVVVHPDLYAEVNRPEFEANSTITAQPWGRVEGVARIGDRPASGAEIRSFNDRLGNSDVPYISDRSVATADAEGRFVLDRVVPGDVRVARGLGEGSEMGGWSSGTLVEVQPDEATRVEVGGQGRPVVARIALPEGFDPEADYSIHSEFSIESDRPRIPYPEEVLARRDESMVTWARQWWVSDEAHEYRRNWVELGRTKLQPDGTLRAEDIPPGDYRLTLTYSADPLSGPRTAPERVAHATVRFTIPEIPGGRSDEPLDLGVLRPTLKPMLRVGQEAPDFEVLTLDGEPLRLSDYRGKYVLLDFWATWCGPCIAEFPHLKAAQERFGDDGQFVLISLSLDDEKETVTRFLDEHDDHPDGIQGFLGPWSDDPVSKAYGLSAIPALFLVGPDGRIVARDLRGSDIEATLGGVLGQAEGGD